MSIASLVLPVLAKRQPCNNIPSAFQYKVPFSPANVMSSSTFAFAIEYFPQRISVTNVTCSANINVAAWPISRASLVALSASESAASG